MIGAIALYPIERTTTKTNSMTVICTMNAMMASDDSIDPMKNDCSRPDENVEPTTSVKYDMKSLMGS